MKIKVPLIIHSLLPRLMEVFINGNWVAGFAVIRSDGDILVVSKDGIEHEVIASLVRKQQNADACNEKLVHQIIAALRKYFNADCTCGVCKLVFSLPNPQPVREGEVFGEYELNVLQQYLVHITESLPESKCNGEHLERLKSFGSGQAVTHAMEDLIGWVQDTAGSIHSEVPVIVRGSISSAPHDRTKVTPEQVKLAGKKKVLHVVPFLHQKKKHYVLCCCYFPHPCHPRAMLIDPIAGVQGPFHISYPFQKPLQLFQEYWRGVSSAQEHCFGLEELEDQSTAVDTLKRIFDSAFVSQQNGDGIVCGICVTLMVLRILLPNLQKFPVPEKLSDATSAPVRCLLLSLSILQVLSKSRSSLYSEQCAKVSTPSSSQSDVTQIDSGSVGPPPSDTRKRARSEEADDALVSDGLLVLNHGAFHIGDHPHQIGNFKSAEWKHLDKKDPTVIQCPKVVSVKQGEKKILLGFVQRQNRKRAALIAKNSSVMGTAKQVPLTDISHIHPDPIPISSQTFEDWWDKYQTKSSDTKSPIKVNGEEVSELTVSKCPQTSTAGPVDQPNRPSWMIKYFLRNLL